MNSCLRSDASEAKTSDFRNFRRGNFKSRTAALAIGTIGAAMMSLVLASAATTLGDHRTDGLSGGAAVQKSPGKCRAAKIPTA